MSAISTWAVVANDAAQRPKLYKHSQHPYAIVKATPGPRGWRIVLPSGEFASINGKVRAFSTAAIAAEMVDQLILS